MKTLFIIFCLLWSFSSAAKDLQGLCEHGAVEGTYQGKIGGTDVRLNLICVEQKRLIASIAVESKSASSYFDSVINLKNSEIDDDQLILSNFLIDHNERRSGSSKSIAAYIKVNLIALKEGRLSGKYMSGNLPEMQNLEALKVQSYSSFVRGNKIHLTKKAVVGTYVVHNFSQGPANLTFDVLDGTPVVYLFIKRAGVSLHLTDGPMWSEDGLFSLVTPLGNGGEPDTKRMFYIRGRFLDEKHIEFYFISPLEGFEGPFTAKRK